MSFSLNKREQTCYSKQGILFPRKIFRDYRRLSNIKLFNYGDMAEDSFSYIATSADYLEVKMIHSDINKIAEIASYDTVKIRSDDFLKDNSSSFAGDSKTLLNKSDNWHWSGTLAEQKVVTYQNKADEVQSPECGQWLEEK